jgi:hypothetical protein
MMKEYTANWGILEVKIRLNDVTAQVEFLSPNPANPGPTSELYGGLYTIVKGEVPSVTLTKPGFIERRVTDYQLEFTAPMPSESERQYVTNALSHYANQ